MGHRLIVLTAAPLFVAPLLLAWLLVACSENEGSEDGAGAAQPSVSALEQLRDTIAEPYCETMHVCCGEHLATKFGASVKECVAGYVTQIDFGAELEAADAEGKITLDRERLDACIAQLQTLRLAGAVCAISPIAAFYSCAITALRGGRRLGERCRSYECAEGYCPCWEGDCADSVCVALLPSGAACLDTFVEGTCDPLANLRCAAEGGKYACQPLKTLEEVCLPSQGQCLSGNCEGDVCAPPTYLQLKVLCQ